MAAATVEEKGFRPGVVSVVQTFGDRANFHPHVHALVSRGGFSASGEWIPVPYVDEGAAEKLFRHKVLALLRRRGLLSEERIALLLSWRRSGFSVHNRVYVPAGDGQGLEAIPDPRRHSVRYYGFYSNVARGKRGKAAAPAELSSPGEVPEGETAPENADRAALRRRWAEMIRRVYEVDPLVCPRCGGEMRVVGFINQPALIKRILDHFRNREKVSRPPPHPPQPVASPA